MKGKNIYLHFDEDKQFALKQKLPYDSSTRKKLFPLDLKRSPKGRCTQLTSLPALYVFGLVLQVFRFHALLCTNFHSPACLCDVLQYMLLLEYSIFFVP